MAVNQQSWLARRIVALAELAAGARRGLTALAQWTKPADMTDEAFAAMQRHFSEKQIVELTVFCGMWNYSNRLCEALHVDLERPDKRIEFQSKITVR